MHFEFYTANALSAGKLDDISVVAAICKRRKS